MNFTQNWSTNLEDILKKYYPNISDISMKCVEIGCFEGRGTIHIIENLCKNEFSKIYCIDPWDECYVKNYSDFSYWDTFFKSQYDRFKFNTKKYDNKIIELRGYSNEMISKIEEPIDFAFIDGDHSENQVYLDGKLIFEKIRHNGIMVFDDYTWEFNNQKTKNGIDKFIEEFKNNINILYLGNSAVIQIKKEITFDVYAINWNESKLLPHFFKHYNEANNIYILDNCSDDDSEQIISKNNAKIIKFNTNNRFDDLTHINLKNNVWKKSKFSDYVIVIDLDEFLFFPEFPNSIKLGLEKLRDKQITIIKTSGYNMFCSDEEFENVKDQYLYSSIFTGNKEPWNGLYDKQICFNPSKIIEINYLPGAHNLKPIGDIKIDDSSSLLLHYKYIGKKYLYNRYDQMGKRLSDDNLKNGYSYQYTWDAMKTIDNYYQLYSNNNIFNVMFTNLNYCQLLYNNKSCIIDTFGTNDVISNTLLNKKIWEPNVSNYLFNNINNNCTFIDIGSNIGFHSIIAKFACVKDIYSFECNKKTFNKFKNTIIMNGWDNINLYNIGVSNKKNNFEFIEVIGNIAASYIKETHIGWDGPTIKSDFIQTDLLDNLIDNNKIISDEILIKIDIEGHELEALEGMTNLLNDIRTKKIIIELNPYTSTIEKLKSIIELLINYKFLSQKLLFNIKNDLWFGDEIKEPIIFSNITIDEIINNLIEKNILEVVFIR